MKINWIIALAFLALPFAQAYAEDKPTTTKFFKNGSWDGELTASKWRGINTNKAWAIGRHSQRNAEEACSGRGGDEREACVRKLIDTPAIEISADCREGVAWRIDAKDRYRLSLDAKAGKLRPIDDEAAWTEPMSHRGRWTVSSWFQLLCPAASKRWHIQE